MKPMGISTYIKVISLPYDYHRQVKDIYKQLEDNFKSGERLINLKIDNVYRLDRTDLVALFKFIRPQQEWLCNLDRLQVGLTGKKGRKIIVNFVPVRKVDIDV